MKKFFKITGIVLGTLLLIVISFVAYILFDGIPKYEAKKIDLKVEVTPERVAQGFKIASMECLGCHASPDGTVSGRELAELPKEFGHIYSKNLTSGPADGIATWTDGEIYYLLRTGIKKDGQYLPIYMAKFPNAADEDLYSVIAWLRSDMVQKSTVVQPKSEPSFLTKLLCHIAWKPLPLAEKSIPLPDTSNAVEHGRYLANGIFHCFPCHSGDFKTVNMVYPEKSGGFYGGGNVMTGKDGPVTTRNLTFDETGIADFTENEFVESVKYCKKKGGGQLRMPMFPHAMLTDTEAKHIFAYLKTVPKIHHEIKS
ncbi:MAG: cytochrome c [Bacteroidia bacterium]